MKLIINYDPINGEAVPDRKVYSYVKELFVVAEARSEPMQVTIGSCIIIEEVRALISEGALSHEDIVFKFEGKELLCDKFGFLAHWPIWPVGFGDAYCNILKRITKSKR